MLHSAGAWPRPTQWAHVGVSGMFPQAKLAPPSLNLRACRIPVFDSVPLQPLLQRTNAGFYVQAHAHVYHSLLLCALCSAFSPEERGWNCAKFPH